MNTDNIYRAAVAVAFGTALLLAWAIGALGVIGAEGDPADHMYLGVIGVLVGGAVGARLRPQGMTRALVATAAAQSLVVAIALLVGEQRSPVTSVVEILGVNGMFVALFLASAVLFRRVDRERSAPGAGTGPRTAR